MRYTDEFRASTVLMLEAAGYPQRKGALVEVAKRVKAPAMTISRWFKQKQNPPPNKMVSEKKIDFVNLIENELRSILGEMVDARRDADYKELATAFGILFDKRQLLVGGSTENVQLKGLIVNLNAPDESAG